MKTIIRLRNQGKAKNPYWWIVVQTSGKRIHGRNHEVVGYWLPRWTSHNQRSIILNKHRLRYWINSGAHMSKKVHNLLSKGGMMTNTWIPYGRSFVYEKPKTLGGYVEEIDKVEYLTHKENRKLYEIQKEFERDFYVMRLLKEKHAAKTEVLRKGVENMEIEIDDNFQIETDIMHRSQQYYTFRDVIDEMDKDEFKLAPSKRVLIKRKMETMMKKGIVSEQELKEHQLKENNFDNVTALELKMQEILDRYENAQKMYEQAQLDSQPLSREEAKTIMIDLMDDEPYKVSRFVDDLFEIAASQGETISKNELIVFSKPMDDEELVYESEALNSEVVIPTPKQYLTPRPNLDALDPEEMYDMKKGPSQAINPNLISASWTLRRKNQEEIDQKVQKRESKHISLGRWRSKKFQRFKMVPENPINPKKRWYYQKKDKTE